MKIIKVYFIEDFCVVLRELCIHFMLLTGFVCGAFGMLRAIHPVHVASQTSFFSSKLMCRLKTVSIATKELVFRRQVNAKLDA